jgi:AraC-like DNA-binding protein
MPVKHIVQRAGFRSDEHLRLAFQKAFGKSPQLYRKEMQAAFHLKS